MFLFSGKERYFPEVEWGTGINYSTPRTVEVKKMRSYNCVCPEHLDVEDKDDITSSVIFL